MGPNGLSKKSPARPPLGRGQRWGMSWRAFGFALREGKKKIPRALELEVCVKAEREKPWGGRGRADIEG